MVRVDDTRVLVPVWAVYLVTALVWPVWGALFVGIAAAADLASRWGQLQLPAFATGLSIILAAVLSYGLGTLVRKWAPPRLWIVPVGWLIVLTVCALVGFVITGAGVFAGLVGVLQPFLFASGGFAVGLHGASGHARSSTREI